ncbi:flagellar biosynthesis protein FlhA [Marinitoga hydrogenitolerans DSM 16785]|uniref:Flagellar biosynthesis protein FlhA n=1 Tax=Marinitoga hydrogenitolerans (strain DSM 16785 / JCM 12826 / AT1271) TaxID=1122195 RepID=A0A1M4X588_MARH1|nr:flagellar biosynthesis protein FlhA [Marinitoga hydrogenitolerans]SHE88587.1 flagellar biosynthesis protein FlhA [Marinitoga hydrogenitolerans DSM 16785]
MGETLNKIFKQLDLIVPLLIVSVVILMVIPIPPFLLDFLQMANISLAIVLLLVTMYIKNALEISAFPTLLLVTTLFRLSLNVSSTRLILLQGKNFQGKVIRAFGDFVVGGNYVVGIVIFLILVIIQFVVITRGAERIAEVAARFTLDAMPGKQMSIDADLSAGIITEEEARQKREDIRREADFYGAMDGASKFVRGDAIAGIIITIINILGGLIIGVLQQGLDIGEAAQLYTLFTVGDGLVAQIPALLISTATGIVVSRAASKENLGKDLLKELSSEKRVLYMTGGVILTLGLVTPLPIMPALLLGGGMLVLAYLTTKGYLQKIIPATGPTEGFESQPSAGISEEAGGQQRPSGPPLTSAEEVSEIIQSDVLEIDIGYGLIPLADPGQGGDLLERITMVRKQIAYELGIVISPIRVRDSVLLSANEYIIKLKGVEVGRFELFPEKLLAINSGMASEEIPGVHTKEPSFNLDAYWIDESQKEDAVNFGYTVVDSPSVFATHLSEIIKKYAHEILGSKETEMLIEGLRIKDPSLVEELVPMIFKTFEIRNVLKELLYERISIRNLPVIFEKLMELGSNEIKDTVSLVEGVRSALSRQICESIKSGDGVLHLLILDKNTENTLNNYTIEYGGNYTLALSPQLSQKLVENISQMLESQMMKGYNPVILCSSPLRFYFSRWLSSNIPNVNVISYNEIVQEIPISADGNISV